MENLTKWMTQALRQDKSLPTWLEERKSEWIPLVKNTIFRLFSGEALVIIADKEREWFRQYILASINKGGNRPYLPILSIDSLLVSNNKNELDDTEAKLIIDYLDNMFSNKYFFWYIGRDERKRSALALSKDSSFLWMFDNNLQNNFTLQSIDPILDIKLMQMYRNFNLALDAVMFGHISLE